MELSEATKWLSEQTRVEHSPIPSPLTPPLENANTTSGVCDKIGSSSFVDLHMNTIHTFKRKEKDTLSILLLFIPIVVFFSILALFILVV